MSGPAMPRSDAGGTSRHGAPFALVVTGSAGSGKSTIAADVARWCGATYLDKDSLAGAMVDAAMIAQGHSPRERESSTFYREQLMPAEYAVLMAVARDNLRLGNPVVIDAPFAAYLDQPDYFLEATARAEWPEVPLTVMQVFAPEAETRKRLVARGLERDRAKLDDWDTFWSRWGTVTLSWRGVRHIRVDSSLPVDLEGLVAQMSGGDALPVGDATE